MIASLLTRQPGMAILGASGPVEFSQGMHSDV